jgi:ribosomal protein L2
MLAPYNLEVGSLIAYGANLDLKAIPRIGRNHFFIRTQLKNLKQGRLIHGVTLRQGAAAKPIIAIAAGTSCKIIQYHRLENKVVLCLPSKQHILVSGNCYATTGQVSKPNHYLKKLKKAGQRR